MGLVVGPTDQIHNLPSTLGSINMSTGAVRFCLQLEASGPSKRIEVATLLEFGEEIIVFMS